ncbi:siphovirus Gp157 family protein [Patescibacteria group bacterium]|nr:MAG: siphovirus Gp157 family protein [Patescibacteria group bacterium]
MKPLYEIADEIRQLAEEIENNDGVLTEDLEARLDQLPMDFEAKGLNVGLWIRNIRADREKIKEEIDRLRAKLKSAEANEQRARDYLLHCMLGAGIEKIKHPVFTASVCAGKEKIDDEIDIAQLPEEYKEVVTTVTPKKKEILDLYKNTGEVVTGCKIVKGNPYLTIR